MQYWYKRRVSVPEPAESQSYLSKLKAYFSRAG